MHKLKGWGVWQASQRQVFTLQCCLPPLSYLQNSPVCRGALTRCLSTTVWWWGREAFELLGMWLALVSQERRGAQRRQKDPHCLFVLPEVCFLRGIATFPFARQSVEGEVENLVLLDPAVTTGWVWCWQIWEVSGTWLLSLELNFFFVSNGNEPSGFDLFPASLSFYYQLVW